MSEQVGKKGKLFVKFLMVFLIISLLPLGIVGYYLLTVSQETLNKAISHDQEALAVGFADTVSGYVINFRNVLADAAHLPDFSSMNTERQKALIDHIMQLHAAFLEISVVDYRGQETVRTGRYLQEASLRDFSKDKLFARVARTGEYIGGMEKYLGSYPAITVGVQITNPMNNRPIGVLFAKMSLTALSNLLKTGFPDSDTTAAVIDGNGFLIAHSDSREIYKPNAKLPDDILEVLLRNDARTGSGEIILQSTGERVLAAFAEVPDLHWLIYIQRSVAVAYKSSADMLGRTWKVMGIVTLFVLFLGYAVSLVITQPILALREAAIRLGEGDFDYVPDLSNSNDEIGDLCRAFMQMSDSLRDKQDEIMDAQQELEKLNRSLENRVDARTRELKSAQDELIKKERLAAIGQMSSVVGHEIRNPLAVINNSIYFIKMKVAAAGMTPDPKVVKHISIIESEVRQANGIIDEILGFARTRELNPKVQSLNTYIEELIMSFPVPEHIKLVQELTDANPMVNIDSDEMAQALRNLIKNGIEVMPEKGTLYIRTAVADEGRMAEIDVEDTGPGIPREALEKIFAPFFTTKARGTGLGLAVVKKVTDRHKGRLEVASTVGSGTCFKIFLPVAEGEKA
jgi:signal transduction histidine kinase